PPVTTSTKSSSSIQSSKTRMSKEQVHVSKDTASTPATETTEDKRSKHEKYVDGFIKNVEGNLKNLLELKPEAFNKLVFETKLSPPINMTLFEYFTKNPQALLVTKDCFLMLCGCPLGFALIKNLLKKNPDFLFNEEY